MPQFHALRTVQWSWLCKWVPIGVKQLSWFDRYCIWRLAFQWCSSPPRSHGLSLLEDWHKLLESQICGCFLLFRWSNQSISAIFDNNLESDRWKEAEFQPSHLSSCVNDGERRYSWYWYRLDWLFLPFYSTADEYRSCRKWSNFCLKIMTPTYYER